MVLGEFQRRISARVNMEASTDEVYIKIDRPIPARWGVVQYHLRHTESASRSYDRDFVFANALLRSLNGCPWLDDYRWHPTRMGMTSDCQEYTHAQAWAQRFIGMTEDVARREKDRKLALCLRRSNSYCWDENSWRIFVQVIFARREATWVEVNVWPDALTFYHLLTRRGLSSDCAVYYMKHLIVVPRVDAFRLKPKKRRSECGFRIKVHA